MKRLFVCLALLQGCASAGVATRTVNDGQLILQDIPEIPAALREASLRYQNMRAAGVADWDRAGKALYIRTRFGDTTQMHRVAGPGRYREQITFFDDPVRTVVRRPRHDALTYVRDSGGSEDYQIHLLDVVSGTSRLLTDGRSRNESPAWNRQGDLLAFMSTRRNGVSKDIWMLDPDRPDSSRILWQAPDSLAAQGLVGRRQAARRAVHQQLQLPGLHPRPGNRRRGGLA